MTEQEQLGLALRVADELERQCKEGVFGPNPSPWLIARRAASEALRLAGGKR